MCYVLYDQGKTEILKLFDKSLFHAGCLPFAVLYKKFILFMTIGKRMCLLLELSRIRILTIIFLSIITAPSALANNPVLTLKGLNPSGGDNTAIMDLVQVYSGTTGTSVVNGAVANGSFETTGSLGSAASGYSPTGTSWTFDSKSGIAANGSSLSAANAPDGTHIAFVQRTGAIQQQLALAPGTYPVALRVSQRACCSGTNDQQLSIQLDGVEIGTVQSTNLNGYDTFVSAPFTVTALRVASVSPAVNFVAFDRTAPLRVAFDRPVTSASAATISVFSAQSGGKRQLTTSVSGNTVTLATNPYFRAGEVVSVVVPSTVVGSSSGETLSNPLVYQLTANVVASTGIFGGTLDPAVGTNAANIAVGDLNGDGKLDLVTADYGNNAGSTVSVLLNTSTGTTVSFAARQPFTTGPSPYGITLGDVDNDGRLDIVASNFGSATGTTVSVLRNTTPSGAPAPSFAAKADFTVGAAPSGVALSDVDGDGYLDLLTSNQSSSTVSVLLNTRPAPGIVSFAAKVDFPVGVRPGNIVAADIDGDGRLDLLTANSGASTVSVLRNTGTATGTASFVASADFPVGTGAINLAVNDLDGDGRLDVVTANNGATGKGTTVSVLRNTTATGTSVLTFAASAEFAVGGGPYSVAIGDIDGDGRLDVAAANYGATGVSGTGATVSVLRSTSTSGAISFATKADYSVGGGVNDVKLADIDGDGDLDILTANQDVSTTSVRLNANTGEQGPLPIRLTAFAVVARQTDAELTWATAQETNNAAFVVERSADGVAFTPIETVAGHGTTLLAHTYSFIDAQAASRAGTLYYRLRQVDLDGLATVSPTRPVTFKQTDLPALSLFPNPAQGHVTATIPALAGFGSLELGLFNPLGQLVRNYTLTHADRPQLELDITGLPSGVYSLQLQDGARTTRRQLTVK